MSDKTEPKFVSAEDLTACIFERKKVRAALEMERADFKEAKRKWPRYEEHVDIMAAGKEMIQKLDIKIDQLASQIGQGILPGVDA